MKKTLIVFGASSLFLAPKANAQYTPEYSDMMYLLPLGHIPTI